MSNLDFLSKEEYIDKCVKTKSLHLQGVVLQYLIAARRAGARICNDGYPDCRFKGTFASEHVDARKFIGKLRIKYDQEVRQEVYEVVSKKVACSYLNAIKQMLEDAE